MTVDHEPPSLSIISAGPLTPGLTRTLTLSFSEDVIGFQISTVSLFSGTTGSSLGTLTGGPRIFLLPVVNGPDMGLATLKVSPIAHDAAGNTVAQTEYQLFVTSCDGGTPSCITSNPSSITLWDYDLDVLELEGTVTFNRAGSEAGVASYGVYLTDSKEAARYQLGAMTIAQAEAQQLPTGKQKGLRADLFNRLLPNSFRCCIDVLLC